MPKKKIPKFKTWEEEWEFWETHSTTDYFDESDETDFLILGGPKSEILNIRIEPQVKAQIERYAKLEGVEFSDMVREWVYEGIEREIKKHFGPVPGDETDEDELVSRIGDIVEHKVSEALEKYGKTANRKKKSSSS